MNCCQVSWIDAQGKPTPDQNPPVAIAWYHPPVWSGGLRRGVSQARQEGYLICAAHKAQVKPDWLYANGGLWEVVDLPETVGTKD